MFKQKLSHDELLIQAQAPTWNKFFPMPHSSSILSILLILSNFSRFTA